METPVHAVTVTCDTTRSKATANRRFRILHNPQSLIVIHAYLYKHEFHAMVSVYVICIVVFLRNYLVSVTHFVISFKFKASLRLRFTQYVVNPEGPF